jgi:hypothetical protein
LTPKLQDYLTASVICLAKCHLCGEADKDSHLSHEGYRWKRGKMLFEDCTMPAAKNCECNRLQDITRAAGSPLLLTSLGTTGAVIFGKRAKLSKTQKQDNLFRLSNGHINTM